MITGKTVLITGGSSGIGLATAKMMVANGAKVAITGTNSTKLASALKELDEHAIAIQADVTQSADLDKLCAKLKSEFGQLDVFFANAGIAYATPLGATDEQQYDQLMNVNVKGVFFSVQAVLPLMKSGSSIILNTSWLNQVGTPRKSVLSASKAAVRSFARSMSAELVEQGIRVNCVSPGTIKTPLHRSVDETEEHFSKYAEKVGQTAPIGRMGEPEEIANAVMFLASNASSYMLGAEIMVDGGRADI